MMFGEWGYGGPGFFGMGLFMLLLWAVLIVGVVALLRWLLGSARRSTAAPHEQALRILAERYARGEIDRNEFEQRRQDLESLRP
jgi:putative membrane protein